MQIPQNWTFKSDHIANNFDQHVREQLPWYDLATFATAQMARHFVPQGGKVYDIGCATGNMGRVLAGSWAHLKVASWSKRSGPGTGFRSNSERPNSYPECWTIASIYAIITNTSVGVATLLSDGRDRSIDTRLQAPLNCAGKRIRV